MAPRRTTPATTVVETAQFNFEEFLAGFERPEFTRSLFRKGKLAPKIKKLGDELDDLDTRIARLEKREGDGTERDITAVSPLTELVRRSETLTAEFNETANEFNASAVEFTFRVPDKKTDSDRVNALMDTAGYVQPTKPEPAATGDPDLDASLNETRTAEFDKEFNVWWDAWAIRSMSVTCTAHPGTAAGAPPLTIDQWEALRDTVGELAFAALAAAWVEAVQAAAPSAPFSLRRSPSPTPEE